MHRVVHGLDAWEQMRQPRPLDVVDGEITRVARCLNQPAGPIIDWTKSPTIRPEAATAVAGGTEIEIDDGPRIY